MNAWKECDPVIDGGRRLEYVGYLYSPSFIRYVQVSLTQIYKYNPIFGRLQITLRLTRDFADHLGLRPASPPTTPAPPELDQFFGVATSPARFPLHGLRGDGARKAEPCIRHSPFCPASAAE